MSDPLSVAGSAVGIVSLGLSVCGTIVKYVQDLSNQSSDLQNLGTKASSVNGMLKSLEKLINDLENDSPETAKELAPQLLCLKTYVDTLEGKIRKFVPVQVQNTSNSMHSKARSALKKATYPFKKEDISEARDCLEGMEITLGATLAIYTLRNSHGFGLKLDLFLQRLETHQLAITASSQQCLHERTPTQLLSYRSSRGVQGCLIPPARNRDIRRAKQARKQYSFYSRWLKHAFTLTFYFSNRPNEFIGPSLRCDTIVGEDSWLFAIFQAGKSPWRFRSLVEGLSTVDGLIQQYEVALSEGKVRPTDHLVLFGGRIALSILDVLFWGLGYKISEGRFPIFEKLIMYLLDRGINIDYRSCFSPFWFLCHSYIWEIDSDEYGLALNIMEKSGPISRVPSSWAEKRNIQGLLHRHDDCVDLPAAYVAVLRESYEDLRCLLESQSASSKDCFNGITLLQLAIGWPEGVRLLLNSSSNDRVPNKYHSTYCGINDQDNNFQEYVHSCQILFQAGYTISYDDIYRNSSNILRSVFVEELAKRRRKLLDIAKAQIPPAELFELREGETGLPDARAPRLWDALIAKGINIDKSLEPIVDWRESIFCNKLPSEILAQIYEAGFTDLDGSLSDDTTPLMVLCQYPDLNSEAISWLISKGANLHRKLPGSNTTIIHLFNHELALTIRSGYRSGDDLDPDVKLHRFQKIEEHLLSVSTRDECSCSCSTGGCTPLSVAIRSVVASLCISKFGISREGSAFRRFIEFLIHYNQSKLEICHAIIRSLTFDGINLKHTCCTELQRIEPWEYVREEWDLEEIREEQKDDIARLETLVSDFQARFDALGLPLMEFLQDIWYERMIKYHSHCDAFDQEHNEGTKEIGVFLQVDESPEIPLCVQLICPDVRVIESDSEESES